MVHELLSEILHRENEIKNKLENNQNIKDILKNFSKKMDDILENTNNAVKQIQYKRINDKLEIKTFNEQIDVYEKACEYINEQFEIASFKDPIFFSTFGVEVQNELKTKKKIVTATLNKSIDLLIKELNDFISKEEDVIEHIKIKKSNSKGK